LMENLPSLESCNEIRLLLLTTKEEEGRRIRNWEDQIMNKFPSNYNNNNKRRKEEEEIFFCRVKSSVGEVV
jgi:hypothetical protein